MDAIRFRQTPKSQAAGCLTYLLAAPIGCFFIGLIAAGLTFAILGACGFKGAIVDIAGSLVWAIVGTIVLFWGFREFQRRTLSGFDCFDDRFEIAHGKRKTVVPYGQIRGLRMSRNGNQRILALITDHAGVVRVPAEVVPDAAVWKIIIPVLMPYLERRTEMRLQDGETITVRDGATTLLGEVVAGGVGVALIATLSALLSPTLALFGLRRGDGSLRRALRGSRRGFTVTRDGLLPGRGALMWPIPWSELELTMLDEHGIVLTSAAGQVLSASIFARNYFETAAWLSERLLPEDEFAGEEEHPGFLA